MSRHTVLVTIVPVTHAPPTFAQHGYDVRWHCPQCTTQELRAWYRTWRCAQIARDKIQRTPHAYRCAACQEAPNGQP